VTLEASDFDVQFLALATAIVPMVAAAALWAWFPPDRPKQGSIVLATTWNAVLLLVFNAAAVKLNWWQFGEIGPAIVGVPVVLWFGWTILWGTVAAQSQLRPLATLGLLAAFDLVYMPLMSGVVFLGPNWLVGEAVALALIAWPSLLVTNWTARDRHLRERTLLQLTMFTCMLFWVIPIVAVSAAGADLQLDVPYVAYGAVLFGIGFAALPGAIAVHEFYCHGGTPWPWESTAKPVRSGPYRFVRAPMQVSAFLVLVTVAFLYREPAIAVAAVASGLYAALFCWLEDGDLEERFGADLMDLVDSQRRWLPSWEPSPLGQSAVVWIDFDCRLCSPIAGFLEDRSPVGLRVRDAADHPETLTRLRYERTDGTEFRGTAAVGASLEHLNLAWAMVGWILRLPGTQWLWQLIGDAVGFGPSEERAARDESDSKRSVPHVADRGPAGR